MPAPKTYESFIASARTLANKGEEYHLKLMHLLVEMEPMKLVWYGHPHHTWTDVLKAERLCTSTAYGAFKKALSVGIPVDMIGVSASCLLAKQPKDVRTTVLRQTVKWVRDYKVPPNYQLVSEYVKRLTDTKKSSKQSAYAKLRAENTHLKARNAQLEGILRSKGIRIPKETTEAARTEPERVVFN